MKRIVFRGSEHPVTGGMQEGLGKDSCFELSVSAKILDLTDKTSLLAIYTHIVVNKYVVHISPILRCTLRNEYY